MEIINMIVLKENGNIIEIKLDMDANKNELGDYLQDKLTFLGQIIREPKKTNIIIISGLNSQKLNKGINKCKLPVPFDKDIVYGDIVLLPMNEKSEPENILLSEYYDLF